MRKNFKKGMCVLAMAAMLATSVTACGSKKADTTTAAETTTEAAAETTTEKAAEETTTAAESTEAETTTEAETKAEAAGEALAEEEYLTKAEELGQAMTDVSAKVQADLASMDPYDTEGIAKLMEELKAPFVEFSAIQAPEAYAEAQAKYKSGCEAMIDYLDIIVSAMEMEASGKTPTEEETQKLMEDMTNALTIVTTDFTEGATLMEEAAGVVANLTEESSSAAQ